MISDNKYIWVFDKPTTTPMFVFGHNKETGENYCDLFDHGIHRVFRDEAGDIIQINLIRDGKMIQLKQDWGELKPDE